MERFLLLKLLEELKEMETAEHTYMYFIYAVIYSFSSKHEFKMKLF